MPGARGLIARFLTYDHGGKVPHLEGQPGGIIAPVPDEKGERDLIAHFLSNRGLGYRTPDKARTTSSCTTSPPERK